MNDDYYRYSHKNSAEDTKVSKGESWRTTERASWLRNFNPRSYAMFIFNFIITLVIIFILYWRYICPEWYKNYIKNYYNLEGSITVILQAKKVKR